MKRPIATLLLGLIGAGILLSLGVWQMQRLAWKEGILDEIESTIAGPAQPLPQVVSPDEQRYQPLALSGTIEEGELHVLVSVKRVGAGYRVIAPFQTNDGRRVLLDRGFVPVAKKGTPRRTGPAEVTGNLHWPDDRNSSTPENDVAGNTWFARDIGPMSEALQTEPLLVIAREVTPADPGLTPLPVDTSGIPNDHLQYAVTWFSLAAIWLAMTATLIWRQRRDTKGGR
ncbi:SURF1 family protein [Aestuariicoccus sp. MJ-SS9]|uniref:SURF1 family protein n=1 Tax=Aestuariicoccus sp. MJ-SS9 TaxID=3079855 RepID=UPI002908BB28|nr:SURF1 family protein [Aestuariicoccus sp. MJ-SS9]MDU8910349.1 SURF1 family protein [Aestuariicoccus sp. MJ-SS9]